MKTIVLGLMLLGFAGPAFGIDKADLDGRIRALTASFEAMQQKPDKSIPAGKVSSNEQPVLIFDDRQGLFGGAAVKAGAITPDEKANRVYYDQAVSMQDILFQQAVKPTAAAPE